jgi:UDP-N-acetylmuramoyl-L-alanyl-D-glutamate--2,6-diaminopimelate ligase
MNKISQILSFFPELTFIGNSEIEIQYIQADSLKIQKKDIFCLYTNFTKEQKIQYCNNALQNGANCVFVSTEEDPDIYSQFPNTIKSSIAPEFMHGKLASFLKGIPSLELKIIAVTGTNGKTSITNILYQLLNFLGFKAGLIGTIEIVYGDKKIQSNYTTPDPSSLNAILRDMVDAGMDFVCMEASSHGLKLGRLEGIHLFGGLFTNLTPDHLDFHPDMQDYMLSKFYLFQLLEKSLKPKKLGLVSTDSPGGKEMLALIQKFPFTYPICKFGIDGDYTGTLEALSLNSTKFKIQKKGSAFWNLETNLLGNFNYINVSMALLFLLESLPEFSIDYYVDKIKDLQPVPGRFEIVRGEFLDRIAVVDYAHTPDAMENILTSIREIPHSQIITIFGCGGDRDRKKRPVMAEIAIKYSDFVIITSDNPRTEDPERILDEIQEGLPKEASKWIRILDRKQAIKKGIEMLPKNGILLVAGKGHENYQIIGTQKLYFSDKEELFRAFQNLLL